MENVPLENKSFAMKPKIDFKASNTDHTVAGLTFPHLPPCVVSFCFDDHVHNNHLICSGCHTQSRLTLLLKKSSM